MTIHDATHALAALSRKERLEERSTATTVEPSMRLVAAIARVEPTWVEAVAVVQAICAQLGPGQAAPPLDTIMISQAGTVSFPPAGTAEDVTTVKALGRLLNGILRTGDCPMPVWEATECARRSPGIIGNARAFGAELTCFPAAQGPRELQLYFQAARRLPPATARPATASFSAGGLTVRAGVLILAAALSGIGAGVSVGALVARKTVLAAPAAAGPTLAARAERGR